MLIGTRTAHLKARQQYICGVTLLLVSSMRNM
jgi:hypothetical protein